MNMIKKQKYLLKKTQKLLIYKQENQVLKQFLVSKAGKLILIMQLMKKIKLKKNLII